MKIYYFSDTDWEHHRQITRIQFCDILLKVASDTQTNGLVVAVYLTNSGKWSGGVAYTRNMLSRKQFLSHRGRWKFTNQFTIPNDLPASYKLIRLHFGSNNFHYPLEQIDQYGWQLKYHSFQDHVAFLFAHELHHFRRYHLNLHPREGENSANKWALARAEELGFNVKGAKVIRAKKKSKFSRMLSSRVLIDPYKKYRSLVSGDTLFIRYDPKGRYQGKLVRVVRPVRKNSRRIVVETEDGKLWRWPMEWISTVN